MKHTLPFTIPEDDLELNLILVFLVINNLHSTRRGQLILNLERLILYVYLIKNPHILHKVLVQLSKKSFLPKSYELSSFKSESANTENLFENRVLKYFIQVLMSQRLVESKYDEKAGFVFVPVATNENFLNKIDDIYLKRILNFIEKIKQINSTPLSQINTAIKLFIC